MPKRGWLKALSLATGQLLVHRDPQEARRFLVQEWRGCPPACNEAHTYSPGCRAQRRRSRYRRHLNRERT